MNLHPAYHRALGRAPLLSAERERELALRARSGDAAARDELIGANLRLVAKVATHYARRGVDYEDLVGWGNVGLVLAADKFDPSRGTRFTTLATWWIRHAIGRGIIQMRDAIRLPARTHEQVARHHKAVAAALKDGKEPPRPGSSVVAALVVARRPVRLDIPAEGGDTLYNLIPDPRAGDADADADTEARVEQLRLALETLPPVEAEVIRRNYGLDGAPRETHRAIGRRLRISREWVRQRQSRTYRRLRIALGGPVPA